MKEPNSESGSRVSVVILRGIVVILVVLAIVFTSYVRFADPDLLSPLGARLLEFNPLVFVTVGVIIVAGYISIMLWSRRDSRRRGWLGRAISGTITLRLGIVLFFAGVVLIGLLFWGLANLLQLLR